MGEDKIIADLAEKQYEEIVSIIHTYNNLVKNAELDSMKWNAQKLNLSAHIIASVLQNCSEKFQDEIMNTIIEKSKSIMKNKRKRGVAWVR